MTSNSGQKTIVSTSPYIELNNQGELLQFNLTKDQHILGRDRSRADLFLPPTWSVMSNCHAIFRQTGNNYQIYDGDGINPSTNGLFINHVRITPTQGFLLQNGQELKIGQDPKTQITLTYFNPSVAQIIPPSKRSISLKDRSVLIGRDPNASLVLESPIVSRQHATIDSDGKGDYILKDFSTNGVFINGHRVTNTARLINNATVKIGPFTLARRGDQLEVLDQGNYIRIDADRLHRIVRDKHSKAKILLNDLSFAIEPGQFVALVGGSGAGKSTLMRTLLGIDPTTKGKVYLNGDDLRTNFNIYRNQIGYVPQDDIIHRELTVEEVLNYAAKLRLPPDANIQQIIDQTLAEIEMTERRNVLVKNLSGGQRKRVSIGVELLADPKLFFLDEPTSGLDPGLDKKMMQLLKKLAESNRTLILVTHATSNINLCDRIIFLGKGGRLCFFGPPAEALDFFGITTGDFADIYITLETDDKIVEEWAKKFKQSTYYTQYVASRLGTNNTHTNSFPPTSKPIALIEQLKLLSNRYFQLVVRDPINLSLALLTAPIGISLIRLALRDQDPLIGEPEATLAPLALRVLFVFTSACLWVGLSSSLQEIVKETAIYMRERLVNLGLLAYIGSKVVILALLAFLQTLLIVPVILLWFKDPEPELISWPIGVGITTFLTLFACMNLGLLISALVKNSSQANSALPLLLLPQIIFAGVLFKMEGLASKFSWLMASRWSVGAYGALVNVNKMVPILPDGSNVTLPFSGSDTYDATWSNLNLNWGALLLHSLIYLGLTILVQKQKDII